MRNIILLTALFFLGGCFGPLKAPALFDTKDGQAGEEAQAGQATEPSKAASQPVVKTFPEGALYEGSMQDGIPHGEGVLSWPDGAQYAGAFHQGKRTGHGIFTWPSGNRFEGEFKDGRRHGQGIFTWANGARYTGTYRMGEKHGTGVFQHANKTVEVCYRVPDRQGQQWEDGQLMTENMPLPDELLPDLMREAQRHPAELTPSKPPRRAGSTAFTERVPAGATASTEKLPAGTTGAALRMRMSRHLSITQQTVQASPATLQPVSLPPARLWRHPQSGMVFARVPAGCFEMGSDRDTASEKPRHTVCLDAFWMGVHEVTQNVWRHYMGILPEQSREGAGLPVENVSWNDTQNFVTQLNHEGPAQFRLPSEAEWEFACRSAGREELFCGGHAVDLLAWHKGNSLNQVHPVGKRQANGLGLYDMSGNVWEWVADWYDAHYYSRSPDKNPKGAATGRSKVLRGGSWLSAPKFLRPSLRYDLAPDRGYHLLGVRLVAIPPDDISHE